MKEEDNNDEKGVISALLTPILIIDIVAVFLFFLGWTYIYFLYHHFGVNVHALDIPIYYFFVYAQPVLSDKQYHLMATLSLAVFIFSIYLVTHLLPKKYRWIFESRRQILQGIVVLCGVLLFPLSFQLARQTAEKNAAKIRSGDVRSIRFFFKTDVAVHYPEEFLTANQNQELRLLTQTKDRFIVFFQPESQEKVLPFGTTYVVFNSDVLLATIEIGNVHKVD
jgi:hypothetical protein